MVSFDLSFNRSSDLSEKDQIFIMTNGNDFDFVNVSEIGNMSDETLRSPRGRKSSQERERQRYWMVRGY